MYLINEYTNRIRVPVGQRITESSQRRRLITVLFADCGRFASVMARNDRLTHGILSSI